MAARWRATATSWLNTSFHATFRRVAGMGPEAQNREWERQRFFHFRTHFVPMEYPLIITPEEPEEATKTGLGHALAHGVTVASWREQTMVRRNTAYRWSTTPSSGGWF